MGCRVWRSVLFISGLGSPFQFESSEARGRGLCRSRPELQPGDGVPNGRADLPRLTLPRRRHHARARSLARTSKRSQWPSVPGADMVRPLLVCADPECPHHLGKVVADGWRLRSTVGTSCRTPAKKGLAVGLIVRQSLEIARVFSVPRPCTKELPPFLKRQTAMRGSNCAADCRQGMSGTTVRQV